MLVLFKIGNKQQPVIISILLFAYSIFEQIRQFLKGYNSVPIILRIYRTFRRLRVAVCTLINL